MREEITTTVASYILSLESIEAFLDSQRENGASKDVLRQLNCPRLLTGNTLSCGCMKAESILSASKHIAGTQRVQSLREDAPKLLECYEELHMDDFKLDRSALPKVEYEPLITEGERVIRPTVARSKNTSGYPGMAKAKKKWRASISYQKERYVPGNFQKKEDAITARMDAEKRLNEAPRAFVIEQCCKKELYV